MFSAKALAQRLLLSRRDLEWDQQDLADKSEISRTYISQIERGKKTNVGIEVIFSLAEALGVTVPYLLGISDDPLGEGADRVQKEMSGDVLTVDVESQEQRKLMQEAVDALAALPPREQRRAVSLLRMMRQVEEEEQASANPRIIE